jgi:DDE superfamily endonuclease
MNLFFPEIGAKYYVSQTEKGYQTQESFFNYVKQQLIVDLDKHGIRHTKDHPFIYLLDGHTSHNSYPLFQWCKENHIILVLFFPNATHILQMCDVAFFGAYKTVYKQEVQKYKKEMRNREMTLLDVIRCVKRTEDLVISERLIKKGFRATGIFPLDAQNCHTERCLAQQAPHSSASVLGRTLNSFSEDRIAQSESLHIDVDSSLESSSFSELLQEAERVYNQLELKAKSEHPELMINMTIMKQQLILMNQTLAPRFMNNSEPSSSPSPSDLSKVLRPPHPFSRSAVRRIFKTKNHGGMTSDEIMEQFKQVEEKRCITETEKAGKAKQRQMKQEMAQTIRNMKKENTAKLQHSKAKTKPGRKRKATESDPEIEEVPSQTIPGEFE